VVRTAGRLAWAHESPRPELLANLSDHLWLAAGKARWNGVHVERYLFGLPGQGLWIADWIRGRGHKVRWFWQALAETFADARGLQRYAVAHGDNVVLQTWCSRPLMMKLERSQQGNPVAWHAPGYGQMQHGQRVTQEAAAEPDLYIITHIGRKLAECEVALPAMRIGCRPDADPDCVAERSSANIVWKTPDYEAGASVVAGGTRDTGREIQGTGGWQVRVIG
jgi:hypothetical protein